MWTHSRIRFFLPSLMGVFLPLLSGHVFASQTEIRFEGATPPAATNSADEDELEVIDISKQATVGTRSSARTMSILVPPPRGQITDRAGEPMAQTIVAYQIALKTGQLNRANETKENVITLIKDCITKATNVCPKVNMLSDEKIWEYYQNRRWLPYPISGNISEAEAKKIREKINAIPGIELLPVYVRTYPEKQTAAHILGYPKEQGKLTTGPINYRDPLWKQMEGAEGLEKRYESELAGQPGEWRLMFDEEGDKVLDQLEVHPKPGGTVVTTINLKWQRIAERLVNSNGRRGALVVLDCQTGEVLVMASNPSYDPNNCIPDNPGRTEYINKLFTDKSRPLYSRAFQATYPPASTFKVVTVISWLVNVANNDASRTIFCPAFIKIGGGKPIEDWSKSARGSIDCVTALALSNNPFMCRAAEALGGTSVRGTIDSSLALNRLLGTADMLGYGRSTKIPIGDSAAPLPTVNVLQEKEGRRPHLGDVMMSSIGQGSLEATPLQVAKAMAAIANGRGVPKLHLIKQVQDYNGNVKFNMQPEFERLFDPRHVEACKIVRKGMRAVVTWGTGKKASLGWTTLAGKTGTAQWGPPKEKKRLAWFAGFLPYENPRFAYAMVYEGRPGETLGGGAVAAPIIRGFFNTVKDDVRAIIGNKDGEATSEDNEDEGDTPTKKKRSSNGSKPSDDMEPIIDEDDSDMVEPLQIVD